MTLNLDQVISLCSLLFTYNAKVTKRSYHSCVHKNRVQSCSTRTQHSGENAWAKQISCRTGDQRGVQGRKEKRAEPWTPKVSGWREEVLQWGEGDVSSKGGMSVELINTVLI